jgi:hypothetical protein
MLESARVKSRSSSHPTGFRVLFDSSVIRRVVSGDAAVSHGARRTRPNGEEVSAHAKESQPILPLKRFRLNTRGRGLGWRSRCGKATTCAGQAFPVICRSLLADFEIVAMNVTAGKGFSSGLIGSEITYQAHANWNYSSWEDRYSQICAMLAPPIGRNNARTMG